MSLLSKSAKAAVSGGTGGFLRPSKIVSGTSVRFALLSEDPVEGYELWADGPEKAMSFRWDHEPTPAQIDARLGEYTRRMNRDCLLYTSPSPRDVEESRMPSSA